MLEIGFDCTLSGVETFEILALERFITKASDGLFIVTGVKAFKYSLLSLIL